MAHKMYLQINPMDAVLDVLNGHSLKHANIVIASQFYFSSLQMHSGEEKKTALERRSM